MVQPFVNLVSTIISVLFVFFLLTDSLVAETAQQCNGRWVHIRRLPPRFNMDLLHNCSEYPVWDDFCPYLANHGLGQKTHNRSESWYRTDASMIEIMFYRRFLEYSCLTQDPAAADAVFVPYFAGIDSLRYLYGPDVNSSAEHGIELADFLRSDSPEIWRRHHGHDHIFVMGRPAWDFCRPLSWSEGWGTSILELPELLNVTAMILESRAWAWQEQAVPHPTSFHPASIGRLQSWVGRVRRSRRTTLMLFAGGGGTSQSPNIRRSIRLECEERPDLCSIVECSGGVCEHDPILYMKPMLHAKFCLQPPGDTPTRRSTFDGMIAGCIPVFFEELSAKKQFTWHLPEDEYDRFSVFVPKDEVVWNGLNISDVLMRIPEEQVGRMRDRVIELMPKIMYRRHGSSPGLKRVKDAFDVAVDGALQRIKNRISGSGLVT
ncbi:probable xyloglucan galactosyltransferase GT19 [Nymphaea colorata]|nr:probable xyloglucan galactosyltransferase GT19 [Nymphaea colorata]